MIVAIFLIRDQNKFIATNICVSLKTLSHLSQQQKYTLKKGGHILTNGKGRQVTPKLASNERF